MKHGLGLIVLLTITFATAALGASSSLILRGHIEPTFKIDFSSGTPRLLSNVKGEGIRPTLKIEQNSYGTVLTVIHP